MLFVLVVLVALFVLIAVKGYVKAPPDVAYIISGLGKNPRILIGTAGFMIPFFERLDKLSLRLINVDVKTAAKSLIPTADYIGIAVDSVVVAKISANDPDKIRIAAQHFLNVNEERINEQIISILEGNLREIVGTMKLRDMISDRKTFAQRVQDNAVPDLNKLGIELLSFNVQNFRDENGIIEALGVENTSQIMKKASISRAEAERERDIAIAENKRDVAVAQAEATRLSEEAKYKSYQVIAEKNTDYEVRKAELKIVADTKRAEADAAYEIQQENQRKTIEITRVNADIAKEERNVDLEQRRASVKEKTLDATVRKQADAELYRRQKAAEAEKYEREQKALAELAVKQRDAEAVMYMAQKEAEAIKLKGEAEAAAINLKGNAEADVLLAKGKAEAEAMRQKAEAYKQYGQAAIIETLAKITPEVAREVAAPLSRIDKITVFGSGNKDTLGVAGNVPQAMGYAFDAIEAATGVDMRDLVKAKGYDAAVTKNINLKADAASAAVVDAVVEDVKEEIQ